MRAKMLLTAMVVLFSVAGQPVLGSAKSEWNSLPKPIFKCMKKMVEAVEKAPLSKIIAAGLSPRSPNYAPGLETCKKFAEGPRKNFECTIQDQSGNNVSTICNESYAIASGSSITKLSADEALDRVIAGQQVQFYLEETPEGLKRRQNALASELDARLSNGSYRASELTGPCLDLYNDWRNKPGAGAFSFSSSGACGALSQAASQAQADQSAIEACQQKSGGQACYIIERKQSVEAQTSVGAGADVEEVKRMFAKIEGIWCRQIQNVTLKYKCSEETGCDFVTSESETFDRSKLKSFEWLIPSRGTIQMKRTIGHLYGDGYTEQECSYKPAGDSMQASCTIKTVSNVVPGGTKHEEGQWDRCDTSVNSADARNSVETDTAQESVDTGASNSSESENAAPQQGDSPEEKLKREAEIRAKAAEDWKKKWAEKQKATQDTDSTEPKTPSASDSSSAQPSSPAAANDTTKRSSTWRYEAILTCRGPLNDEFYSVSSCLRGEGMIDVTRNRDQQFVVLASDIEGPHRYWQVRGYLEEVVDCDERNGIQMDEVGLHICLTDEFSITVQNQSQFNLHLFIRDRLTDKTVYHQSREYLGTMIVNQSGLSNF